MRAPRVMIRARMPERLVRSTASMRVPSARAPKLVRRACAAPASDIVARALMQSAAIRTVLSDDIVLIPPRLTRLQPIERRPVRVERDGERASDAAIAMLPQIAYVVARGRQRE